MPFPTQKSRGLPSLDEDESFHYPSASPESDSEKPEGAFHTVSSPGSITSTDSYKPATLASVTTQLSHFTLEDFESLSRVSSKTVQPSNGHKPTPFVSVHPNVNPLFGSTSAHCHQAASISLEADNDSMCNTYKPFLQYSNNDNEERYVTALQNGTVKRNFRKPVFQTIQKEEILPSDSDDDIEDREEVEEESCLPAEYTVPHHQEYRGTIAEQKQSSRVLPHILRDASKPSTDWKDFLPSRPKALASKAGIPKNIRTNGSNTAEALLQNVDESPLLPHQCDKCGSLLTVESRRRFLLSQEALDQIVSSASSSTSSESFSSMALSAGYGRQNLPAETRISQSQQLEMEGRIIEDNHQAEGFGQLNSANLARPNGTYKLPSQTAMWKPRSIAGNPSLNIPQVSDSNLASRSSTWRSASAAIEGRNLQSRRDAITDGDHTLGNIQARPSIPSDLAYGWGPEEELTESSSSNSTPRILPDTNTGGIGWDSDEDEDSDKAPKLAIVRNEWDPEFVFKKISSPGYAVSSAKRSVINVSHLKLCC